MEKENFLKKLKTFAPKLNTKLEDVSTGEKFDTCSKWLWNSWLIAYLAVIKILNNWWYNFNLFGVLYGG